MVLYPRRCLVTNKGFYQGYKIGDEYIEKEEHLNAYCIQNFSKTWDEIIEEKGDVSYAYWSEWDDADIIEQGFGYTEWGAMIDVQPNLLKPQLFEIESKLNYMK